jgi:hypothetical protein
MAKRRCFTCGEFRGTWHSCKKALRKNNIPTAGEVNTPVFPTSHVKVIPRNRVKSIVLEDMVIDTGPGFEICLTSKGEVYMQYVNTAGALVNRRALTAKERGTYADHLRAAGHKAKDYPSILDEDEQDDL